MPPVPPGLLLVRMRTCAAGNSSHRRALSRVMLAKLNSRQLVNFAGMPAVKTGRSNVAGRFCSHIRTVSQVVPAAMLQVHRRHMHLRRPRGGHSSREKRPDESFQARAKRAPGYRLSPNYFQRFKRMLAPDWAQKMLCIIVPNR